MLENALRFLLYVFLYLLFVCTLVVLVLIGKIEVGSAIAYAFLGIAAVHMLIEFLSQLFGPLFEKLWQKPLDDLSCLE